MSTKRRLHGVLTALAALVVLGGHSVAAPPEPFVLRNDTTSAVVVQVTTIVQGRLVRHRPLTLLPKAVTPGITLPGNKILAIFDGRLPTKALFQGTIPATAPEAIYSIHIDPLTQRVDVKRVTTMP